MTAALRNALHCTWSSSLINASARCNAHARSQPNRDPQVAQHRSASRCIDFASRTPLAVLGGCYSREVQPQPTTHETTTQPNSEIQSTNSNTTNQPTKVEATSNRSRERETDLTCFNRRLQLLLTMMMAVDQQLQLHKDTQ